MALTRREKGLAAAGLAALLLALGYHAAVRPTLGRLKTLRRVLPEKEQALSRLRAMSAECLALRDQIEHGRRKIAVQGKNFRILSFLEHAAKASGLPVVQMKPATSAVGSQYVETRVEVRAERTSIERTMRFLGKVQSARALVSVRELHLKRSSGSAALDVVILVTSLALAEGPPPSR